MNTNEILERTSDQQHNPQFAQAASSIKDKARALQESAQEWQRKATEATRKAATATDTYVRQNPWNAVAYVAIGCFALGFLVGRCRD